MRYQRACSRDDLLQALEAAGIDPEARRALERKARRRLENARARNWALVAQHPGILKREPWREKLYRGGRGAGHSGDAPRGPSPTTYGGHSAKGSVSRAGGKPAMDRNAHDTANSSYSRIGGGDLQSASMNIINKMDKSYDNFNKVKPEPGFSDYAIHSDGYSFDRFGDNEKSSQPIDVKGLAEVIRADKTYDGGAVRLLACEAGKHNDGAAQMLADELGVPVKAPTESVYVDADGNMVVALDESIASMLLRNGVSAGGKWRVFLPRK